MLSVKQGQKVWFEGTRHGLRSRELTVSKVGRRWVTFAETSRWRADRNTGVVVGDARALGKLWMSEDLYRSAKKLEAQWMNFCHALGPLVHRMPRGMTAERIAEARKALGMEQDLNNTEREIFDEVK